MPQIQPQPPQARAGCAANPVMTAAPPRTAYISGKKRSTGHLRALNSRLLRTSDERITGIADLVVKTAARGDQQFKNGTIGARLLQSLIQRAFEALQEDDAFCKATEIPFRH